MTHIRIHEPLRGDWQLAEHVTEPRPSCIGLPRKYGPPPMPSHYAPLRPSQSRTRSERAVRPNKDTGLYGVVPTPNGRYRVTFSAGLRVHTVGTFDTPDEAARAHDAYVLREGLFRPLNYPDAGNPTLEEDCA